MKRSLGYFRSVVLLASTLANNSGHTQNLVLNGDFESPGGPDHSFLTAGDTYITGWTVTADWVSYWQFFGDATGAGTHTVGLGYFRTPGGIEQSLATVPGQSYSVSFYVASTSGAELGASALLRASAGDFSGVFTGPPDTQPPPSNPGWQQFGFQFRAQSPTSLLVFEPLFTPSNTAVPLLDSVEVVPVPEPSFLLLLGTVWPLARWFQRRAEKS